jgi:hypothetical protein
LTGENFKKFHIWRKFWKFHLFTSELGNKRETEFVSRQIWPIAVIFFKASDTSCYPLHGASTWELSTFHNLGLSISMNKNHTLMTT